MSAVFAEARFSVEPQLSWVSKRRWALGAGLFGGWVGLAGCGSEADSSSSPPTVFLITEGGEGLGQVFAAGGEVGTATVWSASGSDRVERCELALDKATVAPECEKYCSGSSCPSSAATSVHLLEPRGDDESDHCFTVGVEANEDGSVRLECSDGHQDLPLPDGLDVGSSGVASWRFASEPGVAPLLAVAAPKLGRVWYYAESVTKAIEVTLGTDDLPAGFGSEVAVLRFGPDRFNSRLLAVSAPDAGQVWLFRAGFPTIDEPFRVGCLGERPGFGRRLASGDVDGDGLTDLLVADESYVTVFSGAALGIVLEQPSGFDCSLAALPSQAILASVSCASGGLTSGCADSDFGATMTVADLDGDSDGELIVGAPKMKVSGKRSGAVLIYDAEGKTSSALSESVVDSDLPEGARFGAAVGVVLGKNTDQLVIGAPGNGSIFLAPCFSSTPAELRPKLCGD